MTKQERVKRSIEQHPEWDTRRRSKALCMTLNELSQLMGMGPMPEKTAEKKVGKSLADFRAAHDKSFIVPRKIDEALDKLGSGWEYEIGFAKLCGVSMTDISNFRDQYTDFVVVLKDRRIWAGTKKLAAQLRSMI